MKTISRRNMLFQAGGGISGLALASLLGQEGLLGGRPMRTSNGQDSAKEGAGDPTP